jgi:hypothetical protein
MKTTIKGVHNSPKCTALPQHRQTIVSSPCAVHINGDSKLHSNFDLCSEDSKLYLTRDGGYYSWLKIETDFPHGHQLAFGVPQTDAS